ncbi:hypothetical protein Tco_0678564 [Tanacetum coccineum]|uniref:Uncharacterized protein n=1 Tax=Tanacetum coccineum TaxID=301880 RepID=A0ABQ4XGK8_9ASTR
MPPRAMTQATIEKLVSDRVAAALAQDRATRGNTNEAGRPGGNIRGNVGGQGGAPPAYEFEPLVPENESVFQHQRMLQREKGKVAAAILQNERRILSARRDNKEWKLKLWNLRVKDSNISAYTQEVMNWSYYVPENGIREKSKKLEAYQSCLLKTLKENIFFQTSLFLMRLSEWAQHPNVTKLQSKLKVLPESNKRKVRATTTREAKQQQSWVAQQTTTTREITRTTTATTRTTIKDMGKLGL